MVAVFFCFFVFSFFHKFFWQDLTKEIEKLVEFTLQQKKIQKFPNLFVKRSEISSGIKNTAPFHLGTSFH
jgi:hypothetical protein